LTDKKDFVSVVVDKNIKQEDLLLKQRPPGIILNEKQWLYLKERYYMTTRELQVAILVCRGFNNKEIADALKIKKGTVKTHLRNLYRRVRVKSKTLLLLRFVDDMNRFYTPPKHGTSPIPILEVPPKSGVNSETSRKK
jgi:DNA-binding NarL/FixJ family response regulator